MGYMIAMTSNSEVNNYAVRRYERIFGEHGTFRLVSPEELQKEKQVLPAKGLFSYTDDFLNLNEVARDFGEVHEIDFHNKEQLESLLEQATHVKLAIPLFIKEPSGNLQVLPKSLDSFEMSEEGYQLVYMGKEMEVPVLEKPSSES
jgi:hypothetical protein